MYIPLDRQSLNIVSTVKEYRFKNMRLKFLPPTVIPIPYWLSLFMFILVHIDPIYDFKRCLFVYNIECRYKNVYKFSRYYMGFNLTVLISIRFS